jgi:outer membrane receptor protein involved in Fe transport
MRGFGTFGDQNTLILVDGQRISENEQVPADLASISLSSIDRIEIMRGSGAVLYGGGATGGTINIITRGAKPNAAEAEIRAGYGTYDTSEFAVGGRVGGEKVGVSVNASQYASNGYRDNNAVRQRNVQTDFRYFGEHGPIYLKLGAGDQDLRLPGSRTEAQLESDRRGTANPNDYSTLRTTRASLGTSQALGVWRTGGRPHLSGARFVCLERSGNERRSRKGHLILTEIENSRSHWAAAMRWLQDWIGIDGSIPQLQFSPDSILPPDRIKRIPPCSPRIRSSSGPERR